MKEDSRSVENVRVGIARKISRSKSTKDVATVSRSKKAPWDGSHVRWFPCGMVQTRPPPAAYSIKVHIVHLRSLRRDRIPRHNRRGMHPIKHVCTYHPCHLSPKAGQKCISKHCTSARLPRTSSRVKRDHYLVSPGCERFLIPTIWDRKEISAADFVHSRAHSLSYFVQMSALSWIVVRNTTRIPCWRTGK